MALFSQSQPSTALPHATLSLLGTVHNLLVGRVRDDHIDNSSGSPSRLEHPRFSYSFEGTMVRKRMEAGGPTTKLNGSAAAHPLRCGHGNGCGRPAGDVDGRAGIGGAATTAGRQPAGRHVARDVPPARAPARPPEAPARGRPPGGGAAARRPPRCLPGRVGMTAIVPCLTASES